MSCVTDFLVTIVDMAIIANMLLLLLIVDKVVSGLSLSNTESVSSTMKGNSSGVESHLHYSQETNSLRESSVMAVLEQSSGMSESDDVTCPTWHVPVNATGTPSCGCGSSLGGVVHCNSTSGEVAILNCYCMTYNPNTRATVAGRCPYRCSINSCGTAHYYTPLPENISNLNSFMCGHLYRTEQLCGECREGTVPPIHTYHRPCYKCRYHARNWVEYIAVFLLPLTIFLLIIICFRISATSAKLNAFVLFCQIIGQSSHIKIVLLAAKGWSEPVARILTITYGFWTLDFFRDLIPLCLEVSHLTAIVPAVRHCFLPLGTDRSVLLTHSVVLLSQLLAEASQEMF